MPIYNVSAVIAVTTENLLFSISTGPVTIRQTKTVPIHARNPGRAIVKYTDMIRELVPPATILSEVTVLGEVESDRSNTELGYPGESL